MQIRTFLAVTLSLVVTGCSVTDLESSLKANRYFSEKEYDRGIAVFSEKVRTDPSNALDNYYLGRFYLAENMVGEAMPYLRKAVSHEPGDSDYQFWLGVAAGEAGDRREERSRYEKTLEISSSHAKARLYLAHLELKEGRHREALKIYDKILKKYPYNAAALYNRALCLKFSGQKDEEKEAWQKYLKYYPAGFLASKAADHLNRLGDFSYRNHQFGYRTVTLKEIGFSGDELKFGSRSSMRLVGALLSNFASGDLQITVFTAGGEDTSRRRAVILKNFLLEEYPDLDPDRVKLSWFDEPETLYGYGKRYTLKESVRIYMTNWQEPVYQ